MRVVCIDNKNDTDLTIGKIYTNLSIGIHSNYWIKNDNGYISLYDNRLFITLEEWREKKLKEIGI